KLRRNSFSIVWLTSRLVALMMRIEVNVMIVEISRKTAENRSHTIANPPQHPWKQVPHVAQPSGSRRLEAATARARLSRSEGMAET
ncbi:hypothetical protein PFISCL1PPCAC_4895, partial [Pristionchus fissidentatus]